MARRGKSKATTMSNNQQADDNQGLFGPGPGGGNGDHGAQVSCYWKIAPFFVN